MLNWFGVALIARRRDLRRVFAGQVVTDRSRRPPYRPGPDAFTLARSWGFYDRDYSRTPAPTRFGGMPGWSATTWLIGINVAVFLIDRLLSRLGYSQDLILQTPNGPVGIPFSPLEYWGHFSALLAIGHLQLWRFITFQFLHANLEHIAFKHDRLVLLWSTDRELPGHHGGT